MHPGADRRTGSPLRGLRWGLLLAVVAALVLFAGLLVFQDGRSGRDTPEAGSTSTAGSPTTSGSTPSAGTQQGGAASTGSTVGSGGASPAAGSPGPILTRGTLTAGWETKGWSWDSAVQAGRPGPDGAPAYSVTYRKPWGGFALRRAVTTVPPPDAQLSVRVFVTGRPVTLGLQVQSADDGGIGAVVQRDVPGGKWVTLTASMAELKSPAGVRRVSVIAQNVPVDTAIWVSDVTLG